MLLYFYILPLDSDVLDCRCILKSYPVLVTMINENSARIDLKFSNVIQIRHAMAEKCLYY